MALFYLTVNASKVAATLSNYPAYIDLADMPPSFWDVVSNGGGDIRCYSDKEKTTELAREVVSCNTSTDTGELHVKIPSLTTTTTIYIDVDGSRSDYGVTDTYGRNAVWSDYVVVLHLDNNFTNSAGNSVTATNTNTTDEAGILGRGRKSDAAGEYITLSHSDLDDYFASGSTGSVSAWYKFRVATPANSNNNHLSGLMMLGTANTNHYPFTDGAGYISIFRKTRVNSITLSGSVTRTNWHLVTVTTQTGTNGWKFYQNTNLTHQTTGETFSGSDIVSGNGNLVANIQTATRIMDGDIDEVRLREDALSANWITTEYNNQSSSLDFWTIGQLNISSTFKKAQVNSSKVASSLSDYPAYVDLTRVKGSAMTQAEANSVRVYSDESKTTELAREIVSVSEMHVKISSLTTTTTIYVDYDGVRSDYAATDTYGRNAVWSGYAGVWHLEESSGTRVDSGGSNNLTDNNTVTSVAGQIGNSADFLGTNSEYLSGTRIGHIEGVPISYTFWVNLPSTSQKGVFIEDSGNGGINNGFAIGVGTGTLDTNANRLIIPFWGVSWQDTTVNIGTGWHMITLIIGSDRKATAYLDGTSVYTGTAVMGVFANSPFLIGRSNYSVAYRYLSDGSMDEVRVIDSALSANWITTEYNNQSDEASFWGTWTDAGGAPVANNGFQLWWA
jgi:hypothetical protein